MSPLWASSTCHYFQFYPYWPFKNHPRRTPRPSEPSAKLKSLFPLLLYYYRSWAGQFYILFLPTRWNSIQSFNGSPFPEPHEGLRIHTFLVKFQCTFHLLKKVRYIIIIITVVVCHRQHFLIAIVIIIPINKIINHHNQCNKCQSFVQPSAQPSTHDDTSRDSSHTFLEKGNKTTSKFNESFNRIKVELPPFLP